MDRKSLGKNKIVHRDRPLPKGKNTRPRKLSVTQKARCLDTVQLGLLENSFREWTDHSARPDLKWARRRILFIFLLIRYAGAKLNEALAIDPFRDIDFTRHAVIFGKSGASQDRPPREIQISEALSTEIQGLLKDPGFAKSPSLLIKVDPGHVRRKFYERAEACGFPKSLGAPDAIRKSRAVELMQNQVPLPVVQRIMGHSTPNLVSSLVSFSDSDMQQMTRFFLERESARKTSARNAFFGKVRTIQKGDIQAKVELVTPGGDRVTAVITNESLARLGLKKGTLITAEVKAPQVILYQTEEEPHCTAENRFQGRVVRINKGRITSEYVVRMEDGGTLCSLSSGAVSAGHDFKEGDPVWVAFTSFSVVLHLD